MVIWMILMFWKGLIALQCPFTIKHASYTESLEKEPYHAMLITEYYNYPRNPRERCYIIKNTWGTRRSHEGFSQVGCKVFDELYVVKKSVSRPW